MNAKSSIIPKLNPQYFWDVDLKRLNENSSARLIIERVFSFGEVHEMNLLIDFYSKEKVIEVLCSLSYLDPKTLNFVAKLFHKPVKAFRCQQIRQSKPLHWNS